MFKLSENSWNDLGHGIQVTFGEQTSPVVYHYTPVALEQAPDMSSHYDTSAPMPAPTATESQLAFIQPAA